MVSSQRKAARHINGDGVLLGQLNFLAHIHQSDFTKLKFGSFNSSYDEINFLWKMSNFLGLLRSCASNQSSLSRNKQTSDGLVNLLLHPNVIISLLKLPAFFLNCFPSSKIFEQFFKNDSGWSVRVECACQMGTFGLLEIVHRSFFSRGVPFFWSSDWNHLIVWASHRLLKSPV